MSVKERKYVREREGKRMKERVCTHILIRTHYHTHTYTQTHTHKRTQTHTYTHLVCRLNKSDIIRRSLRIFSFRRMQKRPEFTVSERKWAGEIGGTEIDRLLRFCDRPSL